MTKEQFNTILDIYIRPLNKIKEEQLQHIIDMFLQVYPDELQNNVYVYLLLDNYITINFEYYDKEYSIIFYYNEKYITVGSFKNYNNGENRIYFNELHKLKIILDELVQYKDIRVIESKINDLKTIVNYLKTKNLNNDRLLEIKEIMNELY